jgi:hypothetical protein
LACAVFRSPEPCDIWIGEPAFYARLQFGPPDEDQGSSHVWSWTSSSTYEASCCAGSQSGSMSTPNAPGGDQRGFRTRSPLDRADGPSFAEVTERSEERFTLEVDGDGIVTSWAGTCRPPHMPILQHARDTWEVPEPDTD